MNKLQDFAKEHLGIELHQYQLDYIEAFADGSTVMEWPRQTGVTTANEVIRAYLKDGLGEPYYLQETEVTWVDERSGYSPILTDEESSAMTPETMPERESGDRNQTRVLTPEESSLLGEITRILASNRINTAKASQLMNLVQNKLEQELTLATAGRVTNARNRGNRSYMSGFGFAANNLQRHKNRRLAEMGWKRGESS